jgi:hypothetical protein
MTDSGGAARKAGARTDLPRGGVFGAAVPRVATTASTCGALARPFGGEAFARLLCHQVLLQQLADR